MKPHHARLLSALSCGLVLLGIAAIAYVGGREKIEIPQEIWWLRSTGYGALGFLCLAILVTPAQRLLQHLRPRFLKAATVSAWRRSLGIASAWLALGHAGIALNTYLDWSWTMIWETPYLRAGAVAAIILATLLVTSFPRLVRFLHIRFWKQLHRLAYFATFFVFQHTLLSPFAERRWIFTIFGFVLLLSLFRLFPRRATSPKNGALNSENSDADKDDILEYPSSS